MNFRNSVRNPFFGVALLLATSLSGCLFEAEKRADWDEDVGFAEAGGVSFAVTGGLAAVREIAPGKLVLWSQAPELEIQVVTDATAASDWTIEIRNIPTDSVMLSADEGFSMDIVDVEGNSRARTPICGTHKVWKVRFDRGMGTSLLVSPPAAAEGGPIRLAVLNDLQEKGDFLGLIPHVNDLGEYDFAVSAGDITHMGERSELERVQRELCGLNIPMYATPGNHEQTSPQTKDWHELFGRHSFHFEYKGAGFTFVDSASATVAPSVFQLLERWLKGGNSETDILITHIPPLEPDGLRGACFRNRAEAAKFLSTVASGGVDLLVHGHIHTYQLWEQAGIKTVITGGPGHFTEIEYSPAGDSFRILPVWK